MNIIESILLVSGDAVAIKDISEKLCITDREVINAAEKLQKKYDENSGINVLIFNKKLQLCSNKKYAEYVSSVLNPIKEKELSKAMLEVAAIIAYKQPITRIDIEDIRGINSEYAVQKLLEIGVIEPVGRKETVGHPILFSTTDNFLKRFQISSLEDLPDYSELLDKIAALNNTSVSLFARTEENAEEGPTSIVEAGEIKVGDHPVENKEGNNQESNENNSNESNATDEDLDLPDIENEEIPDFLQGEDITVEVK